MNRTAGRIQRGKERGDGAKSTEYSKWKGWKMRCEAVTTSERASGEKDGLAYKEKT